MRFLAIFGAALALASAAAPADARRTAIDQSGDISIYYELGGYCDLNGDDCGPGNGLALGYNVKLGSGTPVDRVYVHGNGILTFGSTIDFNATPPGSVDYGLNLVTVGENNEIDFEPLSRGNFLQSATLRLGTDGKIFAEWFTCGAPILRDSVVSCPSGNQQFLRLTPGKSGFTARVTGVQYGDGPGFTIDGISTQAKYGKNFLIPAEITGLTFTAGVPEPSSWAMMVVGFGLAGAALRRRAATPTGVKGRAGTN